MKRRRRVTIKEVALEAQTSTATVSRVLNDSGFVSDELRKRVIEAAEELGYLPNGVARSLKKQDTHTIGVIISDISNPFFAAVVRGIEDTLVRHQYHPLLCNTDRNAVKEEMYVRLLCEKRVDGVIISVASQDSANMTLLKKHGIPWVFVNRRPKDSEGVAVLTDNKAGAFEATMHFISLGHRRISTIAGPQNINTGIDRLLGVKEAMNSSGLVLSETAVAYGDFGEESGYWAARKLLEVQKSERPTAIFVANNQMTIGALRAIKEKHISIPQDIAIIGFDETDWARIIEPPLTTVEQPSYRMGCVSARVLLEIIEHQDLNMKGENIYLPPRLIVRESCGSHRLEVPTR